MKKNNERATSGHGKVVDLQPKKLKVKLNERNLFQVESRLNKVPVCRMITPKNEREKSLQSKEKEYQIKARAVKHKKIDEHGTKANGKNNKDKNVDWHHSRNKNKDIDHSERQKCNRFGQPYVPIKAKKFVSLKNQKKQDPFQKQQSYKGGVYEKHQQIQNQSRNKNKSEPNLIVATHTPNSKRFNKFEIRSAKYSKMLEELKASQEHRISLNSPKPKSLYKVRVDKLNMQIQQFKQLTSRSSETLKRMEKVQYDEQSEFDRKKCMYLRQIKKLKEQLDEYRPNIGHLFSFKQYNLEGLIPDQMILDTNDQCRDPLESAAENNFSLSSECNRLIDHYLQDQSSRFEQSSVDELCLSIKSKESNEG